jgi:hypothetical protein
LHLAGNQSAPIIISIKQKINALDIQKNAIDLGKRIVTSWQSRDQPPEVVQAMRAFHERMKRMMRYGKEQWPYEYEYWVERRGLDG